MKHSTVVTPRVALDAFRLVGPPTSIGTYTLELADALAAEGCPLLFLLPRNEESLMLQQAMKQHPKAEFRFAESALFPEREPLALARWNQRVLPRLIGRGEVDCLISVYHQVPLRIARGVVRVGVVHDCCGLRQDCGYRRLGRAWLKHWSNLKSAAMAAEAIVPISRTTRGAFIEAFPSAERRVTNPIYNKVTVAEVERVHARERVEQLGLTAGSYLLGFGLPGKRKGTDVALAAFSLYRREGGRLPLVLIGGEGLDLCKWGLEPGHEQAVVNLPRVDDITRDSLYAESRALLFFSRCEGFGYPLVEAARQGCPSIAWEATTAREIMGEELPLMQQLSPQEGARLIRYYDELPGDEREGLEARLKDLSKRYTGTETGAGFVEVIRDALERNRGRTCSVQGRLKQKQRQQ